QHAVPVVDICTLCQVLAGAHSGFSGAGVDDIGVAECQCDGPDEKRALRIRQWRPGASTIDCLPHTATGGPDIDYVGVCRMSHDGGNSSTRILEESPRARLAINCRRRSNRSPGNRVQRNCGPIPGPDDLAVCNK